MSSPRPPASSRDRDHAPTTPSALRQSFTASSSRTTERGRSGSRDRATSSLSAPRTPTDDFHETTSLLHHEPAHEGPCNHGTFSPRASTPPGSHGESLEGDSTSVEGSGSLTSEGYMKHRHRTFADRFRSKKMKTSDALAEQHGIQTSTLGYLSYYIPCLIWMRQYRWSWLKGDLTSAITLASMYVPMALSYAENLAHVPAIHGLYAFVFHPLVYALLGSCPQMVVGPEAAGSLLTGSIVKTSIDLGKGEDEDAVLQAKVAGVAVGMAGATVFIMGLLRLGFIDSVLSRPFLRGFISAIGVVIFIDQMIPVLGLHARAKQTPGVTHGSTVEKFTFLVTHLGHAHVLSAIVGVVSFVVIMLLREVKRRLQPRYPSVAYLPDRLLVIVISAVLAWKLDWEPQGVQLLGKVEAASGRFFQFRNPFQLSHMKHIRDAMGTSFLIGMLGFFESSVAAKSLGGDEVITGMQISPNRELIALGVANLVGACFMAIPAFGGYGRSKVNKSTGGQSPMSSILLSAMTVVCILFLLPWFYYLPNPVLSALIMVVAWSLIEEAPHDVAFFLRIRGWTELSLMGVILLVTVFFSLNLGIAIGIGISLLQVIRHATRPRIQILGRIPRTARFTNAEEHPDALEFIEGCLIVKIPEPLTFANTGELKNRLRRLELYGTSQAHPALPRLRDRDANRNVVFDVHGVTSIDGSGVQVLEEIVRGYRARGVRVFFCRAPAGNSRSPIWRLMLRSGIVDLCGRHNFVDNVDEAIRRSDVVESETNSRETSGRGSGGSGSGSGVNGETNRETNSRETPVLDSPLTPVSTAPTPAPTLSTSET